MVFTIRRTISSILQSLTDSDSLHHMYPRQRTLSESPKTTETHSRIVVASVVIVLSPSPPPRAESRPRCPTLDELPSLPPRLLCAFLAAAFCYVVRVCMSVLPTIFVLLLLPLGTDRSLCSVSKYPTPGSSKTRLIPAFGTALAAQLAMAMLTDLLRRFSNEVRWSAACYTAVPLPLLLLVLVFVSVLLRAAAAVACSLCEYIFTTARCCRS